MVSLKLSKNLLFIKSFIVPIFGVLSALIKSKVGFPIYYEVIVKFIVRFVCQLENLTVYCIELYSKHIVR